MNLKLLVYINPSPFSPDNLRPIEPFFYIYRSDQFISEAPIIKNRDGSTFRLRGPNPLLKSQNIGQEGAALIIHNIESLTQEIEDVVYKQQTKTIRESKPAPKPEPAQVIDQPKPAVQVVEQPKPEPVKHKAHNDISKERKPVAYCLPAIEDMKYDMLTGKFNSTTRYGEKFTFEVQMVEEDYLSCLMWGPLQEMPLNSIIYIFDQRRWWKVLGTEPYQGGLLINCMPSEKNPSFD